MPRFERGGEAVELVEDQADGGHAFEPGRGVDVLEAGDEVGIRLGGDGDALAASEGDRESAGFLQVAALGPAGASSSAVEADEIAVRDERFEKGAGVGGFERVAGGQVVEADEGAGLEEAADDGGDGFIGVV